MFQIEKVLQQGEISDCVDPYVTLRECDSGKVMSAEQTVKLFTKNALQFTFYPLINTCWVCKTILELMFFKMANFIYLFMSLWSEQGQN